MINPMGRSTPIRMMGMASGMDTDFIIQNAMRAHQFRIDNVMRQRTLVQWRQQTHNSVRDQLREFQGSLLSMTSPRSIFNSNNWNTNVAALTGDNRNAFSITTRANTNLGSFQVMGIASLARGASVTSRNAVSGNNIGFSLGTRLEDMVLSGTGGNSLRFIDDTMSIDFGARNAQGQIPEGDRNPVEFTRVRSGPGAQDFYYRFENADGEVFTINRPGAASDDPNNFTFEPNSYLSNGVARINIGTSTEENWVNVTQTADGNLQRVNMDTRSSAIQFSDNVQTFAFGEGEDRITVEITRTATNDTDRPWEFTYRLLDHNNGAISGGPINIADSDDTFVIPGLGDVNGSLRLSVNDNGDIVRIMDVSESAPSINWGTLQEPVVLHVDGARIEINDIHRNMTINDMLRTINNNAELAGRATISYDQFKDRFTIQSNSVGESSSIRVEGLELLGLGSDTGVSTEGSHSKVVVRRSNGEIVTLSGGTSNSVNFGGVTINLSSTFNADAINEIAALHTNVPRLNEQEFIQAVRDHFGGAQDDVIDRLIAENTNALTGVLNQSNFITALEEEWNDAPISQLAAANTGMVLNEETFGQAITAHFALENNEASTVGVSINRNIDQVVENITGFINTYNSIISRIEGLLRERKTPAERSYMPLTDEEKQHMTERQIEQWEEIARRGIMRNDHALEALARELRGSFFAEIEGMGMSPSELGLSTGNFFDGTGGQIFIDETRLRAALEADPDRVMEVFTRNAVGASRAEQGLAARINSAINNFVSAGGSQSNTLRGLERSIRNLNEQIERMTVRMFAEEDRLFRQFAAMERAMSQLQSQGDWFNAMLGSMN